MLASGFTFAPVSKFLFFTTIATSLLVSITDTKYLFHIQLSPHLLRYHQLWRLLLWQCCYTNSTELLFAAMTMYHLRVVERLWGSRKFASFLLSCLLPTLLLPAILLLLLRPITLNRLNTLPAGPTPLLFALLAQYHAAIPTIYKYRLLTSTSSSNASADLPPSITFSDKSLLYLLSAQLAFSSLPGSIISAFVGWGVGVAWRAEAGPSWWTRWRCPGWVVGEASNGGRREGIEGLRARLEGESGRGSGMQGEGREGARRRGLGRGVLETFRGAF